MDWNLFWAAVSAIGQVVAIPAFLFAAWIYFKELKAKNCDALGEGYAAILSQALNKPYLMDPASCQTEVQKQEYQIYAYMVWSFLETVIDRVGNDRTLFETWRAAIACECRRHSEWFTRSENKRLFKASFCERIAAELRDDDKA
jgi:hypothetical protein